LIAVTATPVVARPQSAAQRLVGVTVDVRLLAAGGPGVQPLGDGIHLSPLFLTVAELDRLRLREKLIANNWSEENLRDDLHRSTEFHALNHDEVIGRAGLPQSERDVVHPDRRAVLVNASDARVDHDAALGEHALARARANHHRGHA
jgi:hypothetical protein